MWWNHLHRCAEKFACANSTKPKIRVRLSEQKGMCIMLERTVTSGRGGYPASKIKVGTLIYRAYITYHDTKLVEDEEPISYTYKAEVSTNPDFCGETLYDFINEVADDIIRDFGGKAPIVKAITIHHKAETKRYGQPITKLITWLTETAAAELIYDALAERGF